LCFKAETPPRFAVTLLYTRQPFVYGQVTPVTPVTPFFILFFFFLVAGKILYTHAFFTIFGLIHTILCDRLTDQSMRSANYGLFKTRAADRDPSEVDAGQ
jgi:hypothetical protein